MLYRERGSEMRVDGRAEQGDGVPGGHTGIGLRRHNTRVQAPTHPEGV